MNGGHWYLVLDFEHPYDGIEIKRGQGLEIRIPFETEMSADLAVIEMRVTTRQENPVIEGHLVTEP